MRDIQELKSILADIITIAPIDSDSWIDRDQIDDVLRKHGCITPRMGKYQRNHVRNTKLTKLTFFGPSDDNPGTKFDFQTSGKGRTFKVKVVSAGNGMEHRILSLPARMQMLMDNKTEHFRKLYKTALALAEANNDLANILHLKMCMKGHKFHRQLMLDSAQRALEYIQEMQETFEELERTHQNLLTAKQ